MNSKFGNNIFVNHRKKSREWNLHKFTNEDPEVMVKLSFRNRPENGKYRGINYPFNSSPPTPASD